jgi:hypothetical protein
MLKIYLKYNNYIIEVFLIDFHCDTKFPKKKVCGGPPPENVYIFEAPPTAFLVFSKAHLKTNWI